MLAAAGLLVGCASSPDSVTSPFFHLHTSPVAVPEPLGAAPAVAPRPEPRAAAPALLRPYMFGESDGFAYVDSLTFAMYQGVSRTRALDVLSAGAPSASIESVADAYHAARGSHSALLARQLGKWTLVLDVNGATVSNRHTLAQLSQRHAAIVFHTDLAADYRFLYARGGRVVRDFDPVDYLDNGALQTRLSAEHGIGFGSLSAVFPTARSLLLIQRLTGVRLHAADFHVSRFALGVVLPRR